MTSTSTSASAAARSFPRLAPLPVLGDNICHNPKACPLGRAPTGRNVQVVARPSQVRVDAPRGRSQGIGIEMLEFHASISGEESHIARS